MGLFEREFSQSHHFVLPVKRHDAVRGRIFTISLNGVNRLFLFCFVKFLERVLLAFSLEKVWQLILCIHVVVQFF